MYIFLLDDQPIISEIQNSKLKGEITYKKRVFPEGSKASDVHPEEIKTIDCITITDTSINILNFIETGNHDRLFPEAMKFIRIK